jgi:aryl sulfotransferase
MDSLAGVMWHLSDAWRRREEPNVSLVHYDDLTADLTGHAPRRRNRIALCVPHQNRPKMA